MGPSVDDRAYNGPIIDAHHHLWSYASGRYPWLRPGGGPASLGDLAHLRRDYLPDDFARDCAGQEIDRDKAGIERWRQGLDTMAAEPNIHLKLSNFVGYIAEPSVEAARMVIMPCIEAFGPERCMFGSDFPVANRSMSYRDMCRLFRSAVSVRPSGEQKQLFLETAARIYRVEPRPVDPEPDVVPCPG